MLQFLQCKTFQIQAVPVYFGSSWRQATRRSITNPSAISISSRWTGVRRILLSLSDLQVWKDYARTAHIHSAILSYLDPHPQNFYQT